jgi:hypothetical protein
MREKSGKGYIDDTGREPKIGLKNSWLILSTNAFKV